MSRSRQPQGVNPFDSSTRRRQREAFNSTWNTSHVPGDGFDSALHSIANNADARVKGIFSSVTDGRSEKALQDNLN